jgi:hypothetical protein
VERLTAIPEPPSLVDLRRRVAAMLPEVDLPELILEVMAWQPGFVEAFTSAGAAGGRARLADLHVTVAACLTAPCAQHRLRARGVHRCRGAGA